MGDKRPSARPLHRRHFPAPSRHLPHPFPLPQAFESLPDTRYGRGVALSTWFWLTPRPRGHALVGATGINLRRSSRAAVEHTLRPSHLFFFFIVSSFCTGYALGPMSLVPSDRLTRQCSWPGVLVPLTTRHRCPNPTHPLPHRTYPPYAFLRWRLSFLLSLFTNHHV